MIEPSFQGVTSLFILTFNTNDNRIGHSIYYLKNAKMEHYNVMSDRRNFFDQPVDNDIKTYENIQKITTGQGDDYTSGCLLDYSYFKKHYKMIATDLSNQQALDADPKAIYKINFTGNLSANNNAVVVFIIEEAKETILIFFQGTVKLL